MPAIDVQNPKGKVQLITSLTLEAVVYRPDGSTTRTTIGNASNINPRESRTITYNFVIGNDDPSTCRDLIPGPINSSTLDVGFIALYKQNVIGAFGVADGTKFLSSIREQTRPFDIVETWTNPGTGNVVRTLTYTGCYIGDYGSTRNMNGGDIRIVESATVHFKYVSVTDGPGINDAGL